MLRCIYIRSPRHSWCIQLSFRYRIIRCQLWSYLRKLWYMLTISSRLQCTYTLDQLSNSSNSQPDSDYRTAHWMSWFRLRISVYMWIFLQSRQCSCILDQRNCSLSIQLSCRYHRPHYLLRCYLHRLSSMMRFGLQRHYKRNLYLGYSQPSSRWYFRCHRPQ